MNITFLIGNGFDLALGLKTEYKHFYKYYFDVKNDNQDIIDFKKEISDNMENWADFELALGQYIAKLDNFDRFWNICKNIKEEFVNYFSKQQDLIDYTLVSKRIQEKFKNSLIRFLSDLRGNERNIFIKTTKISGEQYRFDFVSFNYTNVLEECLSSSKGPSFTLEGYNVSAWINYEVTHVHGSLNDDKLVFGVNDEAQLAFENLTVEEKTKIIKPLYNDTYDKPTNGNVESVISESSIICIFGMSLGDTDNKWWEYLGEWLGKDPKRQIIWYVRDNNYNKKSIHLEEKRMIENNYRQIVSKKIKIETITPFENDTIEERIHIIVNSDLFQINLVELTEQSKAKVYCRTS